MVSSNKRRHRFAYMPTTEHNEDILAGQAVELIYIVMYIDSEPDWMVVLPKQFTTFCSFASILVLRYPGDCKGISMPPQYTKDIMLGPITAKYFRVISTILSLSLAGANSTGGTEVELTQWPSTGDYSMELMV